MNISYSTPWVHMGTQIILLVVPAVPSKETLRLLCCCLHTPESHYFKHCVKVHLHPFTIFSVFYFLKHFGHMLSHISKETINSASAVQHSNAHWWLQYHLQSVKLLHKIVSEEKYLKNLSSQMALGINSSLTSTSWFKK